MADMDVTVWVITQTQLLDLLRRAAAGEDPELLMVEEYANAEHRETDS